MVPLFVLYTAFLWQSSRISCQLSPRFIDGSLSKDVNINITFFSKYLKGTVLYLVDHDMNNLIMNIDRFSANKTPSVSIRYNEEVRTLKIWALCGCDPCDARMTNFHVTSTIDALYIFCNNHGQQQVPRNHTINRGNRRVRKGIRTILDREPPHTIYVSIKLEGIGCLKSFEYNNQQFPFSGNGTTFLTKCPKLCTSSECNGGQCSPSYPIGPLCDCSRSVLSGPYCNNSLLDYDKETIDTFEKLPSKKELNIKMLWKSKLFNKKYCLLNFVHQYGQVTFSTHQTFLLKGSEIITNINSDRINSLEVDITGDGVKMKVNNKSLETRLSLLGHLTIRVGCTEIPEECDTYEGEYYFVYNSSQLRIKASAVRSQVLVTWIHKNKITVIFTTSGIILAIILIFVVYTGKKCQRNIAMVGKVNKNCNSSEIKMDAESGFYEKVNDSTYDEISVEDTYELQTKSKSSKR